jgi:serine/threonine-protein kinase
VRDTESAPFEAQFAKTLSDAGFDPDTLVMDEEATLRPEPREGSAVIELPSLRQDQLKVLDRLGEGGFAVVERAVQVPLAREVAVKRASADKATADLVVEARVTGHLEHPNVVPIHALGKGPDGEVLLVMKRIEGRSWRALLKDEPDDLERSLDILIEVCRAVHFAHERGVLHRDLKPDNVMVGPFGEIYVLDWGIAVRLDSSAPETLPNAETTEVIGTPGFMAPEMCEPGARLDRRTDVYGLGAILFRVLTGRRPHCQAAARAIQVLARTVMQPCADPGEDAPAELREICKRATAREPDERFESADALRAELERYRAHAATLRLVDEAIARVDALERLTDDERDDVYASRKYYEARFGLEQALKEWPELDAARDALWRAHLTMIRRELRRERPGVAEQIASELDDLPEELESALFKEVSKREKLKNLVVDLDPRRGGRTRGVITLVVAIVAGGTFSALGAANLWAGYEPSPVHLTAAVGVGITAYLGALVAMKVWESNKAARMIALAGVWIWSAILGAEIITFRFDVALPTSRAFVALIISVGLATLGASDKRMAGVSLAFSIACVAILALPSAALLINGVATFVGFAHLSFTLWRTPDPS